MHNIYLHFLNLIMKEDIKEIQEFLYKLNLLLLAKNQDEWDKVRESKMPEEEYYDSILTDFCSHKVISSEGIETIKFEVATCKNKNIKITIDNSNNHPLPHIHIGTKKDKYHGISMSLDGQVIIKDEEVEIPNWQISEIRDWVNDNQVVLNKMWRCIKWGDRNSAEKRKSKLNNEGLIF